MGLGYLEIEHISRIKDYRPLTDLIESVPEPTTTQIEFYISAERQRQQIVANYEESIHPFNTTILGPMASLKTEIMCNLANDLEALGKNFVVFKHRIDKRDGFAIGELSSRNTLDGGGREAIIVDCAADITEGIEKGVYEDLDFIMITELQFMENLNDPGSLEQLYRVAEQHGISVISEGLSTWYNGQPTKQMQTAIDHSKIIALRNAWDQTDLTQYAPMTTRFVKLNRDGTIVKSEQDAPGKDSYYEAMEADGRLAQIAAEYVAVIKAMGQESLQDYLLQKDYILMPSYPWENNPIAVGVNEYAPLSTSNYNTVYNAATIDHRATMEGNGRISLEAQYDLQNDLLIL